MRLVGIEHGAPNLVYHPDVSKQVRVARAIFTGDDKLTELYDRDFTKVLYPFGTATIVGRTAKLLALSDEAHARVSQRNTWWWARWMRLLSAFLSVLSAAVLTAVLFRRLGPLPALVTGMLLVLEPMNAQYSHYAMNDVPMVAMVVLAWVCTAGMYADSRRAACLSLLCGLCLGIGFAIKYQAAYGIIFPAFALVTGGTQKPRRRAAAAKAVLFGVGLAAGILCAKHVILSEPVYFIRHFDDLLHWQANFLGLEEPFRVRVERNALWIGRFFIKSRLWLLLPGVALAVHKLFRRPGKGWTATRWLVVSAAAFCAVMGLTLLLARELMREHDFLTLIPFLAILNAYALAPRPAADRADRRGFGRVVLAVVLVGLTGAYAVTSVADSLALARPDTRRRAQAWCRAHLSPDVSIFREKYTLPVFGESATEHRPGYFTSGFAARSLAKEAYDIVITSSLVYHRYYDRLSPYYDEAWQEVYRQLHKDYRKVAEFRDRSMYFAHPVVTVYAREEVADAVVR